MKAVFRLIMIGVSVLLTAAIIHQALFAWNSSRRLVNKTVELNNDEINEIVNSYFSDMNGQKYVGAEVISFIGKYMNPYLIEVDGELKDDKQSAVGAINTSALYLCQLKRFNGNELTLVEDVSMTSVLSFSKIAEETADEETLLDLTKLIGIVGNAGTNQDVIDAVYAYIVTLKKQNMLMSQNIPYEVSSGSVQALADVELPFVPTDLILYDDTGKAFYVNLNGSIDVANDEINSSFENVSIELEKNADDVIMVCKIHNSGSVVVQYRAIRAVISN